MGRPKTLNEHFGLAWRHARGRRPASSYLLLAILAVALLGVQFVHIRDDPRKFAFFLSLNFIFFFVVLFRALVDFFEIARDHFRERERLFRTTLGDEEFVEQLGRRVAENEKQ